MQRALGVKISKIHMGLHKHKDMQTHTHTQEKEVTVNGSP